MNFQRPKSSKILLIGDSCIDKYNFGTCRRMCPEAPVPVFKYISFEERGGMAKNVYNNLLNLGCVVDLVTNKEKIVKERFIDEKSMQQVLRVDKGETKQTSQLSIKAIEKINFNFYDGIVISDYNKGFLRQRSIEKILLYAKKWNKPVFVDSKKQDLSFYDNCFIKINEYEKESILQYPEKSEIITTLGKQGAEWKGVVFSPPQNEIDKIYRKCNNTLLINANVCGAGDTFLSGLVVYYLSFFDLKESIEFANLCASISVEHFGTYAITLEDIGI